MLMERNGLGGESLSISQVLSFVPRKIIAASLSGTLFSILCGLFLIDPFNEGTHFWRSFISWTPIYLMYSFPVIFIYGTITSLLSDYLAGVVSSKLGWIKEIYLSGFLHLIFGLILLWVSLAAAALFFITDRLLNRTKHYSGTIAFCSLAIPFLIGLIFIVLVNALY